MKLDSVIKKRKSVRNFKSKKPDWRPIVEAIDAMRYCPKAGNNFCLKAILVSDEKRISRIAEASQQEFIKDAKYVVVVCGDIERMENLYQERGKKYLKQQSGAAIENFLLTIEDRGLSTCWIGHFVDHEIKGILGIPEEMEVEALFPVGYERKVITKKKREEIDLSKFLYFDSYGKKKMNTPRKLDV